MNENSIVTENVFFKQSHILIMLILTLVFFTGLYQLRPFLDDSQFAWISVPTYTILPAILTGYSSILAIRLFKQQHFQAKAFVLFAIGSFFWFISELIWLMYEQVWMSDPFPSEADIFYIGSYPLMILFLFILLKPILKSISKNAWLFSIALSFSLFIPSILVVYDDIQGDEVFAVSIALTYSAMSSAQLVPTLLGLFYLGKNAANFSWMLLLFGFIVYSVADTFFLFAELGGSYYDGHPVDLIFVYSYVLLIFALFVRWKFMNQSNVQNTEMFFSERVKFETITKLGIPLTLVIIAMVTFIIMIEAIFIQTDEQVSLLNITIGIIGMLSVFSTMILILNKNLTKLVRMRTEELQEQKNNLENLIEEKTQELLKQERLSTIGELSGRLAHDLRNPLAIMKMSVELLKHPSSDQKLSEPDTQKRLDLINKNITRISHQVDDVLGYVRSSPLRLSNISVHELLKNTIEKINVPSNVKIIISDKDVNINCDPVKIDAVFINFLMNSIQAMPDIGGEIAINISETKDNVKLEFSDSGNGIPEDIIDKIFDPLFTTKQKGTGLGLASCKNIVELHQGVIFVKNNPTTFTIEMPKLLSQETKIETS